MAACLRGVSPSAEMESPYAIITTSDGLHASDPPPARWRLEVARQSVCSTRQVRLRIECEQQALDGVAHDFPRRPLADQDGFGKLEPIGQPNAKNDHEYRVPTHDSIALRPVHFIIEFLVHASVPHQPREVLRRPARSERNSIADAESNDKPGHIPPEPGHFRSEFPQQGVPEQPDHQPGNGALLIGDTGENPQKEHGENRAIGERSDLVHRFDHRLGNIPDEKGERQSMPPRKR